MAIIGVARAEQLIALARKRFKPNLNAFEKKVLHQTCSDFDLDHGLLFQSNASGSLSIVGARANSGPSGTCSPAGSRNGGDFSSAMLRWLLTDSDAAALFGARGFRLWNARITEPLDLTYCRIPVPVEFRYCCILSPILISSAEMRSLSIKNSEIWGEIEASGLKLHGSLNFEEIHAAKSFRFDLALIEGNAQFAKTTLSNTGLALAMDGANITNNLSLWPRFTSAGKLSLDSVRVSGSVIVCDAKLTEAPTAISMEAASIRGNLLLNGSFDASGAVLIENTQIDGDVRCDDASFHGKTDAFSLSTSKIRGDLSFTNSTCKGPVTIFGSEVGGNVVCKSGKFEATNPGLFFYGTKVRGDLLLDAGFVAMGIVRLQGVEIGGQVVCSNAHIRFLTLVNTSITQDFYWIGIKNPEEAELRLENVTLRRFYDERESWPKQDNLAVNGLCAQELYIQPRTDPQLRGKAPINAYGLHNADRVAWLKLQAYPDIVEPQPWFHIARLLEEKGYRRAAKHVKFELRKQETSHRRGSKAWRLISAPVERAFALLEEQPFRILLSVAFCVVAGALLFWPLEAHFAPTSPAAYSTVYTGSGKSNGSSLAYPSFQPLVYALENNLPVVKFGQDDHWAPDPDPAHGSRKLYWSLMVMRWFLIVAGWAQGVILAAAIGARFRN